jgi:hypothetical protein
MREAAWRTPSCRNLVAAFIVLGVTACNSRSPIPETAASPTAPTPTVITPPAPAPVSTLFSLDVNPKAMIGGGVGRGLATLSLPAPAGGMVVTLSSGDPSVTVPSSVTVPAGADTVEFPVTGRRYPSIGR